MNCTGVQTRQFICSAGQNRLLTVAAPAPAALPWSGEHAGWPVPTALAWDRGTEDRGPNPHAPGGFTTVGFVPLTWSRHTRALSGAATRSCKTMWTANAAHTAGDACPRASASLTQLTWRCGECCSLAWAPELLLMDQLSILPKIISKVDAFPIETCQFFFF